LIIGRFLIYARVRWDRRFRVPSGRNHTPMPRKIRNDFFDASLSPMQGEEECMRTILFGALALGSLALTAPVLAQGVSIDVPGFHAGVGDRYQGDDWRFRHRHAYGAYDYYGGGCRDVTVTRRGFDGDRVTKTIRRCD
jgi:hypothetical protein